MKKVKMLRDDIIAVESQVIAMMKRADANPKYKLAYLEEYMRKHPQLTAKEATIEIRGESVAHSYALGMAKSAKTILFSADQAAVFRGVTKDYTDSLEFRSPFEQILLQFDKPLPIESVAEGKVLFEDRILGIMLSQGVIDRGAIEAAKELRAMSLLTDGVYSPVGLENELGKVHNVIVIVFEDMNIYRMSWISDGLHETVSQMIAEEVDDVEHMSPEMLNYQIGLKNLVIACIGFINCDNVKLEEVRPYVNVRKLRKNKNKKAPEPYYVCRIDKVDRGTVATGTGTAHSYRYDVRGHFRRLQGRTIWVRAHQRGLANDVYVPKLYEAPKNAR